MVNVGKSSKSTMHWSFGWRKRHDSTMIMSSRPSTVISFSTICESRWWNSHTHTHTHLKCHTHTRWWVQSLYFSIKMMVKLNHCGSYTNQKLIFTKTNCGRPTWNRGGTSSILFFRRDRLVVLRIHIDLVKPSLSLRKTVKQPANEAIRIRKSHLDQFGIWPHLCWVKASP